MIFVAEIGLNYEGSLDVARRMIWEAKESGADAVKFQFGWRSKEGEINFLNEERVSLLKSWADEANIEFFASIIAEEGLSWASKINMQRYKIAARTVKDNPDLCRKILALGKETFISLGMWDEATFPFGEPSEKRRYIYCRSKYPTAYKDLTGVPSYFNENEYYGYSDHCLGLEACIMAIARGAQYIEKHFTLNKASTSIRDHALSATPEEFKKLVEIGRPLSRLAVHLAQTRPEVCA